MAAARTRRPVRRKGRHFSQRLDDIIKRIVGDMLENRWKPGSSNLQYQSDYDVSEDQVKVWTAQASRLIRLSRGDDAQIKERILLCIEQGAQLALGAQKLTYDSDRHRYYAHRHPNLSALKDFLQLQMEVLGITQVDAKQNGEKLDIGLDELTEVLGKLGLQVSQKEPTHGITHPSSTATSSSEEDQDPEGGAEPPGGGRALQGSVSPTPAASSDDE